MPRTITIEVISGPCFIISVYPNGTTSEPIELTEGQEITTVLTDINGNELQRIFTAPTLEEVYQLLP